MMFHEGHSSVQYENTVSGLEKWLWKAERCRGDIGTLWQNGSSSEQILFW